MPLSGHEEELLAQRARGGSLSLPLYFVHLGHSSLVQLYWMQRAPSPTEVSAIPSYSFLVPACKRPPHTVLTFSLAFQQLTPQGGTPVQASTPTQPGTPTFPAVYTPLPVLEQLSLAEWPNQPQTPTGATTPQQQSPRLGYAELQQPKVNPGTFPPELISLITQHLYHDILPPPEAFPDPDPHLHLLPRQVSYLPPSFAPTPAEQSRQIFRNLALVDKTWGEEATRALWRKLSFGMPRGWESVLRLVEEYARGRRIRRAERMDASTSSGWSISTISGLDTPMAEPNRTMDWTSEAAGQEGRMGEDGEPFVTSPTGAFVLSLPSHSALRADPSCFRYAFANRRCGAHARISSRIRHAISQRHRLSPPAHQIHILLPLPHSRDEPLRPARLQRTLRHASSTTHPSSRDEDGQRTSRVSRSGGG